MDISELISTAVEALQDRKTSGGAVASVTVEPTRDASGWVSYEDSALVTHHNGLTQTLDIRDTALAAALEQHADDEAELGSVRAAVIPIPLPEGTPKNLRTHSGTVHTLGRRYKQLGGMVAPACCLSLSAAARYHFLTPTDEPVTCKRCLARADSSSR